MQHLSSSLIILSGGLDSAVSLAWAKANTLLNLAITFNYGQRAFPAELKAAQALAGYYDVPHQVIELPWLARLLPPAMDATQNSPFNHITDAEQWAIPTVWVPNRNGVFLNIAAAFAEAGNIDTIIFGANLDEAEGFADNSQAYRDALTHALAFSTQNQVKVITPMGQKTKREIVQIGESLQLPWQWIWSCYDNGTQHCGVCASCFRLKLAIKESGCKSPALNQLF
jgi:7-cyano-7-deazaguanine synthase